MALKKNRIRTLCAAVVTAHVALAAFASHAVADDNVRVVKVAEGFETPWALAFLPDGRMLVTDRVGTLHLVTAEGDVSDPIEGMPEVRASGQGGLLDVVLSPDFENDSRIFFSYAQPVDRGARAAVSSARLDVDALKVEDVQLVFGQQDVSNGGQHFGSRLAFAPDGSLFVTLGDRNTQRERSLALDSHLGKIVRVLPDGSVPKDNPFVDQSNALPEVWSYGHRNVQGAAIHPETGVLWTNEHGPRGGDEVNIGKAGANYGWPEVTTGRDYVTRLPFGKDTERDDVEAPVHEWKPTSIAPSGMAFYTGDAFPEWQGNVFIGALKDQMLVRLELDGDKVVNEHHLLKDQEARIRDVRQGPDGNLYVLDETNGRVLRVEPAGN